MQTWPNGCARTVPHLWCWLPIRQSVEVLQEAQACVGSLKLFSSTMSLLFSPSMQAEPTAEVYGHDRVLPSAVLTAWKLYSSTLQLSATQSVVTVLMCMVSQHQLKAHTIASQCLTLPFSDPGTHSPSPTWQFCLTQQ